MEINRDNYEAFILDSAEGSLSVAEMAELLVFLEANPDLKAEFENFENIEVPLPHDMRFDQKDLLKKPAGETVAIDETNYEQFLVAALEGDLNTEEQERLNQFLAENRVLKKERSLFEKTHLVPDENIVFQNKLSLKRVPVFQLHYKTMYYYASSVAAVLIFIILLFNYENSNQDNIMIREVAVTESLLHPTPTPQIEREKDIDKPNEVAQEAASEMNKSKGIVPSEQPQQSFQQDYVHESVPTQIIPDTTHSTDRGTPPKLVAVNQDYDNDIEKVNNELDMTDTGAAEAYLSTPTIAVSTPDSSNEAAAFRPSGKTKTPLSLKEFIAQTVKKKVLGKEPSEGEKNKLSFFDLAEATIKGANKLLGTKLDLNRKYNSQGELTAFAFSTEKVSVYRNTGKANTP